MSEEKFSNCEEGFGRKKKIISVEFWVFEKKKSWKENFGGKKIKVFFLEKKKVKIFVAVKES